MNTRDWQTLVNRGAEALAERDMRYYSTFVDRSKITLPESAREGYRAAAATVLRAALALPAEDPQP